jgi:ribosome modulation factor
MTSSAFDIREQLDKIDAAFHQGYASYEIGLPRRANPWHEPHPKHQPWFDGWDAAQRDYEPTQND